MADILDNGGQAQEAQQINDSLVYGTAERLQQLAQLTFQLLQKGVEIAQQAVNKGVETGNKLLLPETATKEDLDAVEKAVQDPKNTTVEVNAVATTDQGEVVREPVADPWDDVNLVADNSLSQLESQEPKVFQVDAVVVGEPDQLPTQAEANERPLVNDFINKAGDNLKQGTSNFLAQANAYIADSIQVEYQPLSPQQDGSMALSVDKPSLLTQMTLAGGTMAAAAQEELRKLAPGQIERVNQAVQNTQQRMKSAIAPLTEKVQERLNSPSMKDRLGDVEIGLDKVREEVTESFKTEVGELRAQVGNLEGQIATMNQQQAKLETMVAALQAPKPQLNNPRLNQWQSNFVAAMKNRVQKVKQFVDEKVNQVQSKVSDLVESFKQKAVERLQPIVDRFQPIYNQAQDMTQKAGEQINHARQSVVEKVDNAKQFVGEKAMDWQAVAITATANHVLAKHGKTTPMGTTIYEGKHFEFHKSSQLDGNSLYIKDKNQDLTVYKNGEFNKNTSQVIKDQLVQTSQQVKKELDQQKAPKQANAQQQPKALAKR